MLVVGHSRSPSRRALPVFFAVAACILFLTPHVAQAMGAASTRKHHSQPQPVAIDNSLELHTAAGFPWARARLAVITSPARPEARQIDSGPNTYDTPRASALQGYLSGFGMFDDSEFGLGPLTLEGLPTWNFLIANGRATFSLDLSVDLTRAARYGRWTISERRGYITASTQWDSIPPDTVYTVRISVAGLTILANTPVETTSSPAGEDWVLRGPQRAGGITVTIQPNQATRLLLASQTGVPFILQPMLGAISTFAAALAILLLLRRRFAYTPHLTRLTARARRTAFLLLAVALSAAANAALINAQSTYRLRDGLYRLLDWIEVALLAVGLVILVSFAVRGALHRSRGTPFDSTDRAPRPRVGATTDPSPATTDAVNRPADLLTENPPGAHASYYGVSAGESMHASAGALEATPGHRSRHCIFSRRLRGRRRSFYPLTTIVGLVLGGLAALAGLFLTTAADVFAIGPSPTLAFLGTVFTVGGVTFFLVLTVWVVAHPGYWSLSSTRTSIVHGRSIVVPVVATVLIGGEWLAFILWQRHMATAGYQEWSFYEQPASRVVAIIATAFPSDVVSMFGDLLVLGLLPGLLAIVRSDYSTDGYVLTVDRPGGRAVVVLFATYGCGTIGSVFAFRAPLAAVVGGLLLWGVLRWPTLGALPPARQPDHIQKITEIMALRDQQRNVYAQYRSGAIGSTEYLRRMETIDAGLRSLRRSDWVDSTAQQSSWQRLMNFAQSSFLPYQAFARGSGDVWANGITGAKLASGLAVIPVAYLGWIVLHKHASVLGTHAEFGTSGYVDSLIQEWVRWVALGFTFGAVYPRLPGFVGAIKALVLATVFTVSQIPLKAVPGTYTDYSMVFTAVEAFLFLMTLGIAYDSAVLRAQGADWRHIIDLYQLRRVRFSAAYIAPLVLALAVLIQQIVSGHAGAGITEFVRAVPSALPPGSH